MSKLAANLVVVAPSHEFSSAVGQELSAQLHAPLATVAPAPGAPGHVILVTPEALGDPETNRQLAAAGPAYSLVLPIEGAAAPLPSWCTPISTVGRTAEAVAAEIMNDASNKHAVELDPIRSSRAGLSTTAAYVIVAVAGALLLFGCAALVIGLPVGRGQEQVIFEDRGVAFEEAPAIQVFEVEASGPPIPPPAEAPDADEYQPISLVNETGDAVERRIVEHFGFPVAESGTFVGVAISRETEREIYTWHENSIEGDFSCVGVLALSGGSSSCQGGDLDNDDPSLGWGGSVTNGGTETFDASVSGLPPEARWIVFTTDTGWRIVADSADGFSAALWPDWDGLPTKATAYDAELNELWSGSF